MPVNPRRRLAIRAGVAACLLAVPASGFAVARDPAPHQGASAALPPAPDFDRRDQHGPGLVTRRGRALVEGTGKAPRALVLDFLRRNAAGYGLDAGDLATLHATEQSSWRGLRRVQLEQRVDGLPVLDGGVSGTLAPDGRLIAVAGAPQPDPAAATDPQVSAGAAVADVLDGAGFERTPRALGRLPGPERETSFAGGHHASLGLLPDGDQTRLAWSVIAVADSQHVFAAYVDADSGEVVSRFNVVRSASGQAFHHYPGAPEHSGGFSPAGTTTSESFRTGGGDPWITTPYTRLEGDNAIAYSDVEDDIYNTRCDLDTATLPANDGRRPCVAPAGADHVAPSTGSGTTAAAWNHAVDPFPVAAGYETKMFCPPTQCTWNNWDDDYSWQANRDQAATQAFWFVNHFHDHLQDDPAIAFDDASGNFEKTGPDSSRDRDPVHVQVDDGANTEDFTNPMGGMPDGIPDGFPDADHTEQREHDHAARRHPGTHAALPLLGPARQRRTGARRQRRRRRRDRLPRVHARPQRPADRLRRRGRTAARRPSGRRAVGGLERLVRARPARGRGSDARHQRDRHALRQLRELPVPHPADGLPGRLHERGLPRPRTRCPRRLHLRRPRRDRRRPGRRTSTARSGVARSGTCAVAWSRRSGARRASSGRARW